MFSAQIGVFSLHFGVSGLHPACTASRPPCSCRILAVRGANARIFASHFVNSERFGVNGSDLLRFLPDFERYRQA